MARATSAKTSTTDKKGGTQSAKRETTPKADAGAGGGDGTEELSAAVAELTVAGALEDVTAAELVAGVADLTHAADTAVVAERMGVWSEVVAAAGNVDIAQAIHLLSAAEDVEVIRAVVGVMRQADLEHGRQRARLSGELRVAGDRVARREMPVLMAGFLASRSERVNGMAMPVRAGVLASRSDRVNGMAVNAVLRSTSTRALAVVMAVTGVDLATVSAEHVADGIVRMAAADAMTIRQWRPGGREHGRSGPRGGGTGHLRGA